MLWFKRLSVVGFWLVLVFSVAVITAAVKQRFEDGPNRVFSGGALIQGALYQGLEPDWSFVNEIATIELQLLQPEQSRRIWVASVSGRLFIWSGYMDSFMGKLWNSGRSKLNAIIGRLFESMVNVISGNLSAFGKVLFWMTSRR